MAVSDSGLVTWTPGVDADPFEAVVVSIGDGDGNRIQHEFFVFRDAGRHP